MGRIDVVRQVVTCTACELREGCTGPVPFRGDPGGIVVVGEAPGEQEDRSGRPFIGPAGHKLTDLLAEVGIYPDGYVNTVSCFPHGTPTPGHVEACEHNKWAQIDLLDPTYLLLVGKVALKGMRSELELKRGRGRPLVVNDRLCFGTYHPAAALRNSSYEAAMRSDLARFKDLVDAGRDRWMEFIPPSCAACPVDPVYYEPDGLGWCAVHLPTTVAPLYEAILAAQHDDLEAARVRSGQRRDHALAAVEAAADPDWMAQAWDVLVEYLRTHAEFFVDDFWNDTGLAKPREARALGPLVMRAARQDLMVKSGVFRKSTASNMTEKPVWRSLIHVT